MEAIMISKKLNSRKEAIDWMRGVQDCLYNHNVKVYLLHKEAGWIVLRSITSIDRTEKRIIKNAKKGYAQRELTLYENAAETGALLSIKITEVETIDREELNGQNKTRAANRKHVPNCN